MPEIVRLSDTFLSLRAAVRDNKTDVLRTALQTRVDFPFEVDLWSLGVTLYQCATGELPFQPYAGTRKDRLVMRRILDTKPSGVISGSFFPF